RRQLQFIGGIQLRDGDLAEARRIIGELFLVLDRVLAGWHGLVELALVMQIGRENIGVPSTPRRHLDHRHVGLDAEKRQRLDRMAILVARDVLGAAGGGVDRAFQGGGIVLRARKFRVQNQQRYYQARQQRDFESHGSDSYTDALDPPARKRAPAFIARLVAAHPSTRACRPSDSIHARSPSRSESRWPWRCALPRGIW